MNQEWLAGRPSVMIGSGVVPRHRAAVGDEGELLRERFAVAVRDFHRQRHARRRAGFAGHGKGDAGVFEHLADLSPGAGFVREDVDHALPRRAQCGGDRVANRAVRRARPARGAAASRRRRGAKVAATFAIWSAVTPIVPWPMPLYHVSLRRSDGSRSKARLVRPLSSGRPTSTLSPRPKRRCHLSRPSRPSRSPTVAK